jgi:predicted MPP superfamily phosphohydrolase
MCGPKYENPPHGRPSLSFTLVSVVDRPKPKYDLVCVAGDFLDIFHPEPRENQARAVSTLVRELAQRTRVAVCSGNHDDAGRLITADRAPVYEWFARLGNHTAGVRSVRSVVVNG